MSRPHTLALAPICLGLTILAPQMAHAQKPVLTTLYRFDGTLGGPRGALTVGGDGTLYGSLQGLDDPSTNFGSVYSFSLASLKFKTLFTFSTATSGSGGITTGSPTSLTFSSADGMLYGGATNDDGDDNTGSVFRLSTSGVYTSLHMFSGYPDDNFENQDGANPLGPPILASDGNYYGTAFDIGRQGGGSIYKITPAGTFSVVYSFDGGATRDPSSALVEGPDGALYGTTFYGQNNGRGALYKVTKGGTFTLLHTLKSDNSEGAAFLSPLTVGPDGALYGAAQSGGISNDGVIFKVTSAGKFTILHKFSSDGHGAGPNGLALGADGNFYGATSGGGNTSSQNPGGIGTLFEMTPAGQVTTLYKFHTASDGAFPTSLVFGTDGALYGATGAGGAKGHGTIFKMTLP